MSVALFVDPIAEEYGTAVEAATFVIEAAVSLGKPIVLSCTPSIALEIGLSTFDRGVTRTVEGGARQPSPITLLPLMRDFDEPADVGLYESSKKGAAGTLDDLIDLGILASREESGSDQFGDQDPIENFIGALRKGRPKTVFGFSLKPRFWAPTLAVLREAPEGRLVVMPGHFPPNLVLEEPHVVKVHRADIPDRSLRSADDDIDPAKDEFDKFINEAREQAAWVAALIEAVSQEP
jgi:hypothetical protein